MGIRVVRYGWTVAVGSADVLAAQVGELLNAPPLPPRPLRTWSNREGRALLSLPIDTPGPTARWVRGFAAPR